VRRQWQGLLEHYLKKRENLIGLVLIMDARHPLTELDIQMIEWFVPTGNPIHILLTKSDKLSRQQAALTLSAVRESIALYGGQVTAQLFSSLKRIGIEEAENVMGAWFAVEPADGADGKEWPPAKGEKTGGRLPRFT
jgi:GTP-binding protein